MQIIISPARQMKVDTDSLPYQDLPQFLPQAQEILTYLQERTIPELKHIWACSDRLVQANAARLPEMELQRDLTPALLAFTGLQYQAMGASVFEQASFDYLQGHLKILSGFYGLLRPFDGIIPYRLGLSDAAQVAGTKNLYEYWGDQIAKALFAADPVILNLASVEYAKAVKPYLGPDQQFVTCTFGELVDGKVKQKATRAKQARGSMVRYLADHQVRDVADVKGFAVAGYRYVEELSTPTNLVFVNN